MIVEELCITCKAHTQKIYYGNIFQNPHNLFLFQENSCHLPIDLIGGRLESKQKSKMFEEIFTNQGFNHITENILINLDVKSLWRCRLVCKALHQFIIILEKSRKLKKNDFIMIQRLRRKMFLVHSNWKAAFNLICQEDNFYRRRGLIDLLETQDEILRCYDSIIIDSYINTSKLTSLIQYSIKYIYSRSIHNQNTT